MANKKKNTNNNNLKFIINAQYLRDFSFENPKAPESLRKFASDPTFKIDIDVKTKPLNDHGPNIHEVDLIVKGETKVENNTMFIIEASYCGIFTIENVKDDVLERILLIECPKFLFPFLRSIVATCTREGGFPPLLIAPVDFVGMYEQKKATQKK